MLLRTGDSCEGTKALGKIGAAFGGVVNENGEGEGDLDVVAGDSVGADTGVLLIGAGPGGGGCALGGRAAGGIGLGSGTRGTSADFKTPSPGGGPCGGATGGTSLINGGTGGCSRLIPQPGNASISSAASIGC